MIALWLILTLAAPPQPTAILQEMGPVKLGEAAPWFAGWTLDDTVLNRTRLLERRTPETRGFALVFFATWCAPCVKGLEALAAARPRLKAAGVELVLVDFREEGPAVRAFLDARGLQGVLVLLDKFGRTASALGVSDEKSARLPRTVVLDLEGRIRGLFGAEGPDYVDRIIEAVGQPSSRRLPP